MSQALAGGMAGSRPIGYEEAKRLAGNEDALVRRALARRADIRSEILYYLAEDPAVEVRREIAANERTPRQADLLLARDADETVRQDLAVKIARLAPSLTTEQREHVQRMTQEVIAVLARDHAARVRRIVAEALKDLTDAPPAVIQQLARDAEIKVAAPVLQFSPLLSEADLLEIIQSGPIRGALTAISRRRGLGTNVTDAIVGAAIEAPAEAPAIAALLDNESAQIREETLDRILDQAPSVPAWHQPLVCRPRMPARALKRLAGFVADSLLDLLQSRPDLDPQTARAVAETVERRLSEEQAVVAPEGEEAIGAAVAAGDRKAVAAALARDSGLPLSQVDKILGWRNAKGVTALAWKAGLPMRLAVQLQLRIAGLAPRAVLYARDGVDYPMTVEEMSWQLTLFADPE